MHFHTTTALALASTLTLTQAIVLPASFKNLHLPAFGSRAPSDSSSSSTSHQPRSFSVPIHRDHGRGLDGRKILHPRDRTPEEVIAWGQRQVEYVRTKYGNSSKKDKKESSDKRQTIGLVDVGGDSFYYAQVSVGTPAQLFNVVLDTGSADFWLAQTTCTNSQCQGINLFDSSKSSSFQGSSNPFDIQYGTGAVEGTLAAETVSLAGYTVNDLTFAEVDRLASNTLNPPLSGLMGMGFQSLSTTGAKPFWQVLADDGKLDDNVFSFQLARNLLSATSQDDLNPGGVFTLGKLDSAQYSGDITYADVPYANSTGKGYWAVQLDALTLGTSVANLNQFAAIDTGTTLIGGPVDVVEELYSQIPNSAPLSGSGDFGMYSVPCSTRVNVSLTFGGRAFSINPTDFIAGAADYSGRRCLGAFFSASLGTGAPDWIVGDAFLKSVVSFYQYSPAQVGFANLVGSSAQTVSVDIAAVPSGSRAASGSSSSATADGGGIPPVSQSVGATATGLPTPSAAATNAASTPSLQSGGSGSGGGSGGGNGAVGHGASWSVLFALVGTAVGFGVLL